MDIAGWLMIDKRLLIDSVQIEKVLDRDEWGKESYGGTLTLSPVRFDRATTLTHGSKDDTQRKPGVIFVYSRYCKVILDDSYVDGRIIDGDKKYKVIGIIPISLYKKVIGYEIEVI